MKIVKLNRRWRQYKEHHHVAAVRFNSWSDEAHKFEQAMKELTRTSGWSRDGQWYGYFGKPSNRTQSKPYFITVRDESLITMALLKVNKSE